MEGGPEQPTSAQIEEAARQAGLDYVYQPVVAGQITELDVRTFANHYNELQNRFSCSAVLKPFKQSLSISQTNGFVRRLNKFISSIFI